MVRRAKQQVAETSGATSGGRVAAYLRGEAEAGPAPEKVLERLLSPAARPQEPQAAQPAGPIASADELKLAALAKPLAPVPAPAAPPPPAPASDQAKPADLSKADEKLSSLLGKR